MQWSSIYNKVFTYRFLLTAHPGQWYVKCEGSQNSIFYFVEYNCFYLSRHPYMLLTAMYCDSAVLLRSSHFTIHKQTFRCILYFLWAVIRLLCFSEDNLNQRFRYRLMAKKSACWHENLQNLLGRTILYFVLDSTLNKPALHVNLSKMAELVLSLLWADSIYYQYRISILMLT